MDREKLKNGIEEAIKNKTKRNFIQSVELIMNFRNVDFKKPENRISMDVALPKGRGDKAWKVAVIGDAGTLAEAKKANADLLIDPNEIEKYTTKQWKKKLAKEYVVLVQPKFMGIAAKHFAKFFGARGKALRPLVGDVKAAIERARRLVRVTTRGKHLPTIQVFIGRENMDIEDIVENAEAVLEAIKTKIPEPFIKSIYIKLTMSKPVRVK